MTNKPTQAEIEAAARALHLFMIKDHPDIKRSSYESESLWTMLTDYNKKKYKEEAKAALEAAAKVRDDE